jgi:hypothetical protein
MELDGKSLAAAIANVRRYGGNTHRNRAVAAITAYLEKEREQGRTLSKLVYDKERRTIVAIPLAGLRGLEATSDLPASAANHGAVSRAEPERIGVDDLEQVSDPPEQVAGLSIHDRLEASEQKNILLSVSLRNADAECERLRNALRSTLGWVEHWKRDRSCNLVPTAESLDTASEEIRGALSAGPDSRPDGGPA